jgi:hypothetical protein
MVPLRKLETQTQLIEDFNSEFAKLYSLWRSLICACPSELIYKQCHDVTDEVALPSVGEYVLRSAAAVEQTCGGITANLWDDGFEWTLPETLATQERILQYLEEVESTRRRAFKSFLGDSDLLKLISMPSGEVKTLASLLLQTLARACQLQGHASLTAERLSAQNTSGFII